MRCCAMRVPPRVKEQRVVAPRGEISELRAVHARRVAFEEQNIVLATAHRPEREVTRDAPPARCACRRHRLAHGNSTASEGGIQKSPECSTQENRHRGQHRKGETHAAERDSKGQVQK